MRIAFLAPMKAPDHPVPSGDRQMARLLLAALRLAGHEVELASHFRSFAPEPDAPPLTALDALARDEVERLAAAWMRPAQRPDLIFTYHLHYKAPDLIGPRVAARLALPTATAEASLSGKRAGGPWAPRQALVAAAVGRARLNLCFTARDRAGLCGTATPGSLVDLPPFIDTAGYGPRRPDGRGGSPQLVTVAMMREGDKLRSYLLLGEALARLLHLPWRLTVIGDGRAREEVQAALAPLGTERVTWCGTLPHEAVAARMAQADLLVWPGFNEAFGLCYLEAQAAGLPVVAVNNAGTPAVIRDGETGLLTPPEASAFGAAVERLLTDHCLRERLGAAAHNFVHGERHLAAAAARLGAALHQRFSTAPS